MPFFQGKKSSILARFVVAMTALVSVALVVGVLLPLQELPVKAAEASPLVIEDLTVIDTRNGIEIPHQAIVVIGNRISFVGPTEDVPVFNEVRRIAGAGKYVIPGLWDAHIHTLRLSPQLHFPLLLANGVTSVRDMGDACSWSDNLKCLPEIRKWKDRIAEGSLLSPRIIATASYHVENLGQNRDVDTHVLENESRALLVALKARGDDFIKLQLDDHVNPLVFSTLVTQAHLQGMRIAGHLPFSVDLLDPLLASVQSVEHDSGLLPQCSDLLAAFDGRNRSKARLLARADDKRCDAVLASMARNRTGYVPTHIASIGQDWHLLSNTYKSDERIKYVALPQRFMWRFFAYLAVAGTAAEDRPALEAYYRASQKMTQRALAHGVAVMAGSDSMDPYVTHGFGLHDELLELVQAGLTPAQALRAASWTPALHFGLERDYGSIEAGKFADMLILDKNPLQDIQHARAINLLIFDGKLYTREDLDAMLSFTASQASSLSVNSKFLWGMIKPWQ